jgi:hypothetical protein
MNTKLSAIALSLAALLPAVLPVAAHADVPGRHPGYLHALTDLRDARWSLEHRAGDAAVSGQEDVAVTEIDRAINDIKTAARFDEKDLRDHPHEDAHLDRPGRLHNALDLLRKAHGDLAGEEDNPEVRGLRRSAIDHVDRATGATEHAIVDVEHRR